MGASTRTALSSELEPKRSCARDLFGSSSDDNAVMVDAPMPPAGLRRRSSPSTTDEVVPDYGMH